MRLSSRGTNGCAGVGLAFLPIPLIRDDVASGALVPVLPDIIGDTVQVSVVFADREYLSPKVRVFIDRAVPALEAAYRHVGEGT